MKVAICLVLMVQLAAAQTCSDCYDGCGLSCRDESKWQCLSTCNTAPLECDTCKTASFEVCVAPCYNGCHGIGNCPPQPSA